MVRSPPARYSRPRVSDDNPYAEAVFRTAKYRPEFPVKGFAELADLIAPWIPDDGHSSIPV